MMNLAGGGRDQQEKALTENTYSKGCAAYNLGGEGIGFRVERPTKKTRTKFYLQRRTAGTAGANALKIIRKKKKKRKLR